MSVPWIACNILESILLTSNYFLLRNPKGDQKILLSMHAYVCEFVWCVGLKWVHASSIVILCSVAGLGSDTQRLFMLNTAVHECLCVRVCVSNRAEEESAWSSAWTWVFVWSEPDTRPGQRSEVYNHPQLAVLQPQTHRPPDQQLDRPKSLVQHVPDMNVTLIQTETLMQRDMKLHTFTRIIWNAYYIQIIWFHLEICVHLQAVSHFAIIIFQLLLNQWPV